MIESSIMEEAGRIAQEQGLARRVGEALMKWYPGYAWHVTVAQGVVTVQNLTLSGKWGFHVFEKHINADMHNIMRSGGELLERYNAKRGSLDESELESLPRDFIGQIIGDTTK